MRLFQNSTIYQAIITSQIYEAYTLSSVGIGGYFETLIIGLDVGLSSRNSGGLYSYMAKEIGPGNEDVLKPPEFDVLVPFCGLPFCSLPFVGTSSWSNTAGGLNRC